MQLNKIKKIFKSISTSLINLSAVALEQGVLREQLKANVCQMSVSF